MMATKSGTKSVEPELERKRLLHWSNLLTPNGLTSTVSLLLSVIWKIVSVGSNLEFVLTLKNGRIFQLLRFFDRTGWLAIAFVAFLIIVYYLLSEEMKRRPKPKINLATLVVFTLFGVLLGAVWGANNAPPAIRTIAEWGIDGAQESCTLVINGQSIFTLSEKYLLVGACGINDPLVDPNNDPTTAVGVPFQIKDGRFKISVHWSPLFVQKLQERIHAHGPNSVMGDVWHQIFVVPKDADVSKIHTLSDVPKVGGKFL